MKRAFFVLCAAATLVTLVLVAGNQFSNFADSIAPHNGVAGAAYAANLDR